GRSAARLEGERAYTGDVLRSQCLAGSLQTSKLVDIQAAPFHGGIWRLVRALSSAYCRGMRLSTSRSSRSMRQCNGHKRVSRTDRKREPVNGQECANPADRRPKSKDCCSRGSGAESASSTCCL